MTEPFYVARSTVQKVAPLHRRARLASGETFDMGVHGPVIELFKLAPPRALPLPVDYIVGAAAG